MGIPDSALLTYGPTKPRWISISSAVAKNKDGKLILVTAITPTPAGEGKTTTTVGLVDGLARIGKTRRRLHARAVARAAASA